MLSSEVYNIIVVKDILYRDKFSINLYIYYYNRLNRVTQQNCVQKSLNCVVCTVYAQASTKYCNNTKTKRMYIPTSTYKL